MASNLLVAAAPQRSDQVFLPALTDGGLPVWEAADTRPREWRATGLGSCFGAIGNQRLHRDVHARLYLTDARCVVVADDFAKGTRTRARGLGGGVVSAAIATQVSNARARHAAQGLYMYGQLRHPWVSRVVYGRREGRHGDNSIRICATHRSAFGDRESAMLIVLLERSQDPLEVARAIRDRVVADRRGFERTTPEQVAVLDVAGFPDPRSVPAGQLPSVSLPGSWVMSAETARFGLMSGRRP